jgi:hypothetical protein
MHAQFVSGQNGQTGRLATQGLLGFLPSLALGDRAHVGVGVGVAQVWREAAVMDADWTPVAMMSAGVVLYRRASTRFGIELDAFGGSGSDDMFPDERMGLAVAATAAW